MTPKGLGTCATNKGCSRNFWHPVEAIAMIWMTLACVKELGTSSRTPFQHPDERSSLVVTSVYCSHVKAKGHAMRHAQLLPMACGDLAHRASPLSL